MKTARRTSGDFLASMARASRSRARRLAARNDPAALRARALARAAPPELVLSPAGFDCLAEVKFASPALGVLAAAPSASAAAARARAYASAGACAVSVLTEPSRFRGALAHLAAAAAAARVPAMRKDFLVDPLQVFQARAAGAGGVLIVVRIVDERALDALLHAAGECGVFALLEAFDEADLERTARALERFPQVRCLVGVNARDLVSLRVEPERHLRLAPHLPRGVPAVAESGLETPAQVRAVAREGYRLALVGGALMRAAAVDETLRALLAAGRAGARQHGGAR